MSADSTNLAPLEPVVEPETESSLRLDELAKEVAGLAKDLGSLRKDVDFINEILYESFGRAFERRNLPRGAPPLLMPDFTLIRAGSFSKDRPQFARGRAAGALANAYAKTSIILALVQPPVTAKNL